MIRPLPKPTEPSPLWQNAKGQSGETSWPVQMDHTPLAEEASAPLSSPSTPLMATYLADYSVIAVLGTILVYLWVQ